MRVIYKHLMMVNLDNENSPIILFVNVTEPLNSEIVIVAWRWSLKTQPIHVAVEVL